MGGRPEYNQQVPRKLPETINMYKVLLIIQSPELPRPIILYARRMQLPSQIMHELQAVTRTFCPYLLPQGFWKLKKTIWRSLEDM